MEIIKFTIIGTSDDPEGNPIPKLKMTGRQHWTPGARRYVRWKDHVVKALMPTDRGNAKFLKNVMNCGKPLLIEGRKARMDIFITWKDNKRPDAENVFGSIADALFKNDKHLAGSFDFDPQPTGQGSVEVTITL